MHPMDPHRWMPQVRACLEGAGRIHVLRAGMPLSAAEGYFHQIPTLQICLAGTARILLADGAVDLAAGDAVLMEPCVWHRDVVQVDQDLTIHIGFMARCTDISLRTKSQWHLWTMPFDPSRRHIESGLLAVDERTRRQHVRAVLRQVATAPLTDLGMRGSPLMGMLHGLWRMAYDRSVSPAEVLRKSQLSRSHAYRLFNWAYGMGPGRAIEVMRLDLARWLLFRGHRVGEVAEWSGFPTRHAFTKRWIAQFGASPRRFRGELAPLPAGGYASNHLHG